MNILDVFNSRRYVTISYSTKWAKVYRRSQYYCEVLLNFQPSAYPDLISILEIKGCSVIRLCNYDDGLGFIAFHSEKPFQDITEALQQLDLQHPIPVTHKGKA